MTAGGGGPKVISSTHENSGVLSGLTAINRGINFSYDRTAWRHWYAESNTPKSVQMRRDP
jgi:hypothetical protein